MDNLKTLFKDKSLKKRLIVILFALFIVALIWIIVFKCNANKELNIDKNSALSLWERLCINAIPFQTVITSIMGGSISELLALIFNVVCFLPFGALLCFIISKKAVVLSGFAFSFAVEIFQLFSAWGGFDLTDVLLNTVGTFLGVILYNKFFAGLPEKAVNITALVCIAILLPLDIFALINTILNFPV